MQILQRSVSLPVALIAIPLGAISSIGVLVFLTLQEPETRGPVPTMRQVRNVAVFINNTLLQGHQISEDRWQEELKGRGFEDNLTDAWGNKLLLRVSGNEVEVRSTGADGITNTYDDVACSFTLSAQQRRSR
ncbi:MAG: hypothetical protein AB8G99_21500 [Planctomycetaceae bacterium]